MVELGACVMQRLACVAHIREIIRLLGPGASLLDRSLFPGTQLPVSVAYAINGDQGIC